MELRDLIREMVNQELDELARISTNIKIGNPEKFAAAQDLYAGTWIGDMLDFVEEAGEAGIPQPDLARKLGKSGQQAINPKVRAFLEDEILSKGELSVPKKEKAPSTGIKGRPTSEKTLVAKAVNQKMEADAEYQPSEDELAALGPEFIEKLRMRVKGLLKRGRPLAPSKSSDGMVAAVKNIMAAGDENADGIVDDEDLEDEEDIQMESKSLNESLTRMQKLAGIIK